MFTKADIEKYFLAEKQSGLVFLIIGIIAIVAALVFFLGLKTNFYKGAAVPFIVIGLLCGIIGYNVYSKSDGDRKRNVYAYDMNPDDIKTKELPRMEKVKKSFIVFLYAESTLFILGLVLFVYFKNNDIQAFWRGFGLALAIMSLVALSADYFAQKRGSNYFNGLKEWSDRLK